MTLHQEDQAIVTPGELLATGEYENRGGIRKNGEKYYSTLTGVLFIKDERIRVRPLKSRYFPKVGDKVIGYIIDTNLTSWVVDIRGPYDGLLLASNAMKGRFDPIKDDTRRIFDVGDVVKAEIMSFDRTRDPMLTTKYKSLGKLDEGRIIEVSPNHIPRIIGTKGSMVSMLKRYTDTRILVAQNGRVWIRGDDKVSEQKVIDTIRQITRESHTDGLTDRIKSMFEEYKEN